MTGSCEKQGHCLHGQSPADLLDAGIELLPASCTPDSPRPWASRVEPGPIDEEEPLTSARKKRIFLACACILVRKDLITIIYDFFRGDSGCWKQCMVCSWQKVHDRRRESISAWFHVPGLNSSNSNGTLQSSVITYI
jgi:hypothetical protein